MKFILRIKEWIASLFSKSYFKRVIFVGRMSDIPEHLLNREAYIVKKGDRLVWLVFNCPCVNPHKISINLSENRLPFWRVDMKSSKLSVYPSVWLKDGCNNHFWIRNGNIIYVP